MAIEANASAVPDGWLQAGVERYRHRQWQEAIHCFEQQIRQTPRHEAAWHYLGECWQGVGDIRAAMQAYRQALEICPNLVASLNNLANLLGAEGKFDEAIWQLQRAIGLEPELATLHLNLTHFLVASGRWQQAEQAYREAIAKIPGDPWLNMGWGEFLHRQGQHRQAVEVLRRTIALWLPDQLEAAPVEDQRSQREALVNVWNLLGAALHEAGCWDEAVSAFHQAIHLSPKDAAAHHNLGLVYHEQKQWDLALQAFRRAVALQPGCYELSLLHEQQHLCLWEGTDELCRRILASVELTPGQLSEALPMPPQRSPVLSPYAFTIMPIATSPASQQVVAKRFAAAIAERVAGVAPPPPVQRGDAASRRLRLGYLSADFKAHAMAYMLPELWESHDRRRVEVLGYSLGIADGSDIRRRLMQACDRFTEVTAYSHLQARQQILDDRVDILIDLQGYTLGARPEILAMRAAPIQISYLGFPGTMGADFIDYAIVDDYVVPPEQARYFTERLIYMPGCYQVNDSRHEVAAERPTRADCQLPETAVVLCCFNSSYKLTPAMFEVWMRILRASPDSVLWLAGRHPLVQQQLSMVAARSGVDPGRLIFAPIVPIAQHLARQPLADLFLDSFPYNAHATASIALRMGVPLVTLSGSSMLSRVAGSLLRSVGLPELITRSFEEYEALAIRLANEAATRAGLRQKLAVNLATTTLFDGQTFARRLEEALIGLWQGRYAPGAG
jgi:protein O-GlcNAc transferase